MTFFSDEYFGWWWTYCKCTTCFSFSWDCMLIEKLQMYVPSMQVRMLKSITVVAQLPMQKIINSFSLSAAANVGLQQLLQLTYYVTSSTSVHSGLPSVPHFIHSNVCAQKVRQSFAWKEMKNAWSNTWCCEQQGGGRLFVCLSTQGLCCIAG